MRTIAALRQAELVSLAKHAAKGLASDGADTALVIVYDATGFVQGALFMCEAFTVEELKAHSNPDIAPPQIGQRS